ncbi:unnamed protein product [Phaeothamnion confervicola]
MWSVFLLHHIIALTPYAISNFYQECTYGMYELVLFLLVETSTVPLNAVNLYELTGKEGTRGHTLSFYCLFASWALFRVVLPVYLLICVWIYAFPHVAAESACLVPSLVCAHLIVVFCVYVFFAVLVPDFVRRMRGEGAIPKEPLSALASGGTTAKAAAAELGMGIEFGGDGSERSGRGGAVVHEAAATAGPRNQFGKGKGSSNDAGARATACVPAEVDCSVPYRAMDDAAMGAGNGVSGPAIALELQEGNRQGQFETLGQLITAGPRAWASAFGREMHVPHVGEDLPSPMRANHATPTARGSADGSGGARGDAGRGGGWGHGGGGGANEEWLASTPEVARTPSGVLR